MKIKFIKGSIKELIEWGAKEDEMKITTEEINLKGRIEYLEDEIKLHIANERAWIERCEKAESRIKELENNIPDPEWCCKEHKAFLVVRIKELEEGIEKHKEKHSEHGWWQSVDEELYKVLKEEK